LLTTKIGSHDTRTPEYLVKAFWWQASLLNAGWFIQVAKGGFLGIMWVVS
jgi:hypothetical protein